MLNLGIIRVYLTKHINFINMKKIYFFASFLFCASIMHGQLIINEVLYDPSNTALEGDANGDGTYDQEDDSFLEIYNSSSTNFDISGYEVWDSTILSGVTQQRYVIPSGILIPPNGVLVIFGGGIPVGNFGGAVVLSADTAASGLSLNNSGEYINIKDTSGTIVLTYDTDALSNNPNESYTRNPDITGIFEQHEDNTPLKFSPGTRINGTPFDTNIVVTNLSIQGMNGVDSITTQSGTLQMVSTALPVSASDKTVTWTVVNPVGNAIASIDSNGLLTALTNGVAFVVATSNDGLGVTAMDTIIITNQATSLKKIESSSKLSVYPNPAIDIITIDLDVKMEQFQIFSITGKLMIAESTQGNSINIESLTPGIYFLRVTADSKITTSRFIKQ